VRTTTDAPVGTIELMQMDTTYPPAPPIEVLGLTKRFGDVVAVDDVSFTTEPGAITAFLGPNGAGKTTTLRMLLGLVKPTSGAATVDHRAYRNLPNPRRTVGAVLESSTPYPGRSARQHLRIEAVAADAPDDRVDDVLRLVDLQHAAPRRVGSFSLGMRQRLALATALLCDPPILILDEPTNGLDPEGVRWLRRMLRDLADGGRTIIVSSHILAEVAKTVDRVLIMDHGRLIADAAVPELLATHHGASLEDVFLDMTTDRKEAIR
jgi:ABC-2 type transport system ATP-binding protein